MIDSKARRRNIACNIYKPSLKNTTLSTKPIDTICIVAKEVAIEARNLVL